MAKSRTSARQKRERMLVINKRMEALNIAADTHFSTAILLAAGNATKEMLMARHSYDDEQANIFVRAMINRATELLGELLQGDNGK